jgi:aminoglycoside 6'-N-acetyltransferase I
VKLEIRRYRDSDWDEWLRMSLALFDGCSEDDLTKGMREFRARSDGEVFVVDRGDGSLAGFVEAGSRPYAEGCETSPVGYVEAWYIDHDVRRQGYGRALLQAAEEWARAQGYREMASDALLDNEISHRAHKASGYSEVERIVTFRKEL